MERLAEVAPWWQLFERLREIGVGRAKERGIESSEQRHEAVRRVLNPPGGLAER
jgi:hypothetical protein